MKPTVDRLQDEARSLKRLRQKAIREIESSPIARWMRYAVLFGAIGLLFVGFDIGWWVLGGQPLLYHIGSSLVWGVLFDLNGLLALCGAFYAVIALSAYRTWRRERRLRHVAVAEAQRLLRQHD